MATITTRAGKGSPLTNDEVDANFTNLNTDKAELSGASFTGNVSFGDNVKATFGANDLQIYHDGSNSYIDEQGTGSLNIRSSTTLRLQNASGTNYLYGTNAGEVVLYHNGSPKLYTTSTGIDVTGSVTADGLETLSTSGDIGYRLGYNTGASAYIHRDGATGHYLLQSDETGASWKIETDDGAGPLTRAEFTRNGDISFYEDTGTTAKLLWSAAAEDLQIGGNLLNLSAVSSGTTGARISGNGGGTLRLASGGVDALYVVDGGNVGLGTDSPSSAASGYTALAVSGSSGANVDFEVGGAYRGRIQGDTNGLLLAANGSRIINFFTNSAERMRLDASGNLLVGKSGVNFNADGTEIKAGGELYVTQTNAHPLQLNRLSSDGNIVQFYKDGSTVGSIGTEGSDLTIGTGDTGLQFRDASDAIRPFNVSTNAARDASIDLGRSSERFRDLFLSGTAYSSALNVDGDAIIKSGGVNNTPADLSLWHTDVSIVSGDDIAVISAEGSDSGGSAPYQGAKILFDAGANWDTGSSNYYPTNIKFFTQDNSGTDTIAAGPRMTISSAGNVGIGTSSPDQALSVVGKMSFKTGATTRGLVGSPSWEGSYVSVQNGTLAESAANSALNQSSGGVTAVNAASGQRIEFKIANSERMRIDASGRVGIGTSSPSKKLEVFDSNNSTTTVSGIEVVNHSLTTNSRAGIAFRNFDNFGASLWSPRTTSSAGALVFGTNGGAGIAETNITERMRIDSSGDVIVGGTSSGANDAVSLSNTGYIQAIVNGDTVGYFNRRTSDGEILRLQKDGSTVGSIGVASEYLYIHGTRSTDAGLMLGSQTIAPASSSGANRNNEIDLGFSGNAFKDLYLSGSVTSTGFGSQLATTLFQQNVLKSSVTASSGAFVRMAVSSASNPTYAFEDDTDTGVFTSGANTLNFATASTERMRIDSSGDVGIGESSPSVPLHIKGSGTYIAGVESTSAYAYLGLRDSNSGGSMSDPTVGVGVQTDDLAFRAGGAERVRIDSSGDLIKVGGVIKGERGTAAAPPYTFSDDTDTGMFNISNADLGFSVGGTERMRINSSGYVGIGTASPSARLEIKDGSNTFATDFRLSQSYNSAYSSIASNYGGSLTFDAGVGASNPTFHFKTNGTERMRLDANGNLLVGTTDSTLYNNSGSGSGASLQADGQVHVARNGNTAVFNRLSTDGDIVDFRKNGAKVGSISSTATGGGSIIIGNASSGIMFRTDLTGSAFIPANPTTGNQVDNSLDVGHNSIRFDDVYATNGTIQTSDRNEKQDIEALSDAEQRVAVAAKGLLRKFRWIDSVEEKGDDARIHFGIIAQDLQDAFTAEGLDAGRYAMFINSTWTDQETGEERSRMGVRYSELLAFIISAI